MNDQQHETTGTSQRRFDRGARLHLLLITTLIIVSFGGVVYRFSLPTDGWLSAPPDDFNAAGFVYQENVMGINSSLRPGDYLIAVEGISVETLDANAFWPLREQWQAGNKIHYTVVRGGRHVPVETTLVNWDLSRSARVFLSADVGYLGFVLFLGISVLAFWRRPENPAARALVVLATSIFTVASADTLLPNMFPDSVFPVATVAVTAVIFATFTLLLPPAFIRFALVFPRPSPILAGQPWIAWLPYVVGFLVLVAFFRQMFVLGFIWTAASALIALAILIYHAFTMRDSVSRAQLRWGLGGMIAGLSLFVLTYIAVFLPVSTLVESLFNLLTSVSFGIMGVALGIAVMRYRLFDIDVIIRKTTSYAILTALLALVYFGSVIILQRLLAPLTGDSTPVIALSTLLIAALFLPLRRRVQATIDRRFFRRKYDAEKVLEQFAATVRDETDLDALTAELLRVIQETMEPESISLWLRPVEGHSSPVKEGPGSPANRQIP
jgi:hypothetical protein